MLKANLSAKDALGDKPPKKPTNEVKEEVRRLGEAITEAIQAFESEHPDFVIEGVHLKRQDGDSWGDAWINWDYAPEE